MMPAVPLRGWDRHTPGRSCLVGLLALPFGPKSQKSNQRGYFWRVFFQKQLLFHSSFLKAGLTLLLAFGFLFFEIGGIKRSFIVVSREIKIKGIFYTCLTKQLLAFLQLTAHSSFLTAHSPQQLSYSHTSTEHAQPLLQDNNYCCTFIKHTDY